MEEPEFLNIMNLSPVAGMADSDCRVVGEGHGFVIHCED